MLKKVLTIASATAFAFGLTACEVKKTQEGHVDLPKYQVEKTQEGSVKMPKYDVKTPDVSVTTQDKKIEVPTVKTEERTIEVPKVKITPASEK